MTGAGDEGILAGKGQKARIEAHQVPFVLGNGGGQIVEPEFSCTASELFEGVNMAAHERLETLAVSELEIHLAAVALHQAESVEFAGSTVVEQGSEVTPIDIEAFAGTGFDADIGAAPSGFGAPGPQVVSDNGFSTVITQRAKTLSNDRRPRVRVLLQQFGDSRFEGIEFTGPVAACGSRSGIFDVFGDSAPANVEVGGDFAQRPPLHTVQTVKGVDLIRSEHR